MTKKEHYKMYKSGKNWVYASLATIALLTGATVVAEQHHGHSIAGISAKADDTDYNTRAAAAVNDATTTHDEVASVEDVTFNSPEEAVVGKWVNLTTVTGVAKDGDQSIDYKVNNVYVRKDQSTGKLIAAYVGGKTQITITPRGANNSVSVEIGKRSDTDGNVGTFSTIKRYSTDTDADGSKTDPNGAVVYVKDSLNNPLSFTLPSTFNATDDTLRVAYIPDTRAPHTAKTTSQAYPTPKIQMRTADALKTEIADALKQSDDSKAAKASAAAAIDNAKKEIENKINNDPTLDDTARDAQKKKAEETFKKAEEDIAKMDNKTDVDNRSNQAITDATNAYQPGESMDNQKTDATNALNAAVADEYNKVDSNNDLTQAEKDYLHDLIEADKKKLVQAITDAKDKNDLNAVNAQLIKGNDGLRPGFSDVKVTPAETVADRKTNAETVLNTAYSKAQNDINGNKTLSDAEKTERLTQLKEDYDKAKTAIQNATNAQTVVDALAQSQTDFANDNKDNDLAQRKSDLINDYKSREKVQERLDAIKNDDTLTDAEKISQTKQITDAVDAVSKNISAQETAQDAINAAAATKTKEQDDIIEGAHVPGKPLADQVTDAKNDIHKKADAARTDINNNKNLTDDQKAAETKKINDAEEADKAKLDNPTNAQDLANKVAASTIDSDLAGLKSDVENNYPSLDNQKKDAQADIHKKADAARTDINNNKNLTDDQKAAETKKINDAEEADKAKLDNPTNAQDLANKVAASTIDSDLAGLKSDVENNYPSLDNQKKDAQADIHKKADAARTDINNNKNLTDDQKAAETKKINDAEEADKAKLDNPTNAQDLANKVAASTIDLDLSGLKSDVENNYSSLDDQKKDAAKKIDAAANAANDAIDANKNLTDDDKKAAKKVIADEAKKATDALNDTNSAQELSDSTADSDFKKAVNDVYNDINAHTSLDDQKKSVTDKIAADQKAAEDDIDANKNLSDDEKKAAKKVIDDAAKKATDAVNNSDDAQSLKDSTAAADFKQAVEDENKEVAAHASLDDQQKAAKEAIAKKAQDAKDAINSNKNLSAADKKNALEKIDQAVATVDAQIEATTDATTLGQIVADTSFDTAIQSVLDEANNQPSLDARKDAAKQALIAEANKQKAAIDADLTLSPADKAAQKAKIDAILADAEQKLAAADSYDDVLAINADAITAMEAAHQSGNGLYVEPKAAEAPKAKATLPATAQRVDRHASAGLLAAASLSLGAFFAAKKKSKKQG